MDVVPPVVEEPIPLWVQPSDHGHGLQLHRVPKRLVQVAQVDDRLINALAQGAAHQLIILDVAVGVGPFDPLQTAQPFGCIFRACLQNGIAQGERLLCMEQERDREGEEQRACPVH